MKGTVPRCQAYRLFDVSEVDLSVWLTWWLTRWMDAEREFVRALGRRIREGRVRAGLTQQDLGDEIGLSRTSITNIESGNQQASVWLLQLISVALDCSPAALLPTPAEVSHAEFPHDVPPKAAAFLRGLDTAAR